MTDAAVPAFPPEPAGWTDVDIAGLATLLGCSKYWVRDQVTAKAIPCYRLGRRKGVRFTWRHLCEIRAMREQRPAHEVASAAVAGHDHKRLNKSLATLRRAKSARAA